MRRPAIGLGDWLRATAVLGIAEPEAAAEVALLLGMRRRVPAAAGLRPVGGTAAVTSRDDVAHAARAPASIVTGEPKPGMTAGISATGANIRVEQLPTRPMVPPPAAASITALPPPAERIDAALDPLLEPRSTRALLAGLAALPVPSGEIDTDALAAALASARPLSRLPQRLRPSLRRGLQVLIDAAPGMEPFAADARQFVAALGRLLPPHALQVGHFLGSADLACWFDAAPAEEAWPAPRHGAPLLLLSDCGSADIVRLARTAHSRGVPVRVLAPLAPARRRALQPLPWDRSLTVGALRRGGDAPVAALAPAAGARRLAVLASLAVRVDMPLLRRLRRTLLPGSDPGAEAAAWRGPWVQVHNADGFVLRDDALPALRAELAADAARLAAAWSVTEAAHRGWPASLRLEERLTWLALRGGDVDWAAEWGTVLAAVAANEARAQEIARWAVRAVPRLPPAARDAAPARAVLVAAALRIGAPAAVLGGTSPPAELLQPLLPSTLPPLRTWALASVGGAFVLREPRDGDTALVELPATRPPLALLRWALPAPGQALHAVLDGQPLPLPADAAEVEIAALDGRRWRLVGEGAADALPEWARRCTVQFIDDGRVTGLGVAVAEDLVLTGIHVVAVSRPTRAAVPRRFDAVVVNGVRMTQVEATPFKDPLTTLVGARLPLPLPSSPVPLGDATPGQGDLDVTVVVAEDGRLVTDRGALRVSEEARAGRFELTRGDRLGLLRKPGSPLIAGGRLAGLVALGVTEAEGVEAVRRFLRWAARPRDAWPRVALVGGDDEGLNAEAAALLSSVCLESTDGYIGAAPLRGAVLAMDGPRAASAAPLACALRRWADPSFALVELRHGSEGWPLTPYWPDSIVVDLDAGEDDEHRAVLREAFDPDLPVAPDPAALRGEPDGTPSPVSDGPLSERDFEITAAKLRALVAHDSTQDEALALFVTTMRAAIPAGPALAALREAPAIVTFDAIPLQAARVAIERAWYPATAPRIVALREQSPWTSPEQVAHAVAEQVAAALGAPHAAVAQHLRDLPSRWYVVLLQRPPPPPKLLLAAKKMLGGAVFVCLAGPDGHAPGHAVLPLGLPDGGVPFVMNHYKPLAQIVSPRPGSGRGRAKKR